MLQNSVDDWNIDVRENRVMSYMNIFSVKRKHWTLFQNMYAAISD